MDNLRALTQNVDTAIPLNGGTASVLVENHNPLEKNIIEKTGKMTGFPFTSKRSPVGGVVPSGCLFWNGAAMNTTVNFDMFISKFTLDGNYFTRIADLIDTGAIMHFKDFVGRSVLFEVMQVDEEVDPENNAYLKLSVKGFAENLDYSYLVAEEEICMLEFLGNFKGADFTIERIGDLVNLKKESVIVSTIDISADKLLEVGIITVSGNDVLVPNATAKISGNIHTKSTPTTLVTPYATPTYKRIDIIEINNLNQVVRKQGTETLATSIQIQPTVSANAVLITTMYVSDSIIVTPPSTGTNFDISIQNAAGIEQYKSTNFLKFDGVSFDAPNKLMRIDPLVPLSVFLDITNGSDTNGTLQNANRPFKTIQALLTALPVTTGETYTIFITGGTINFTRMVTPRNLRFVAYNTTSLDFTNVLQDDGVTQAVKCIKTSVTAYTWTFENNNISLISNYVGIKPLNTNTERIIFKGTLFNHNWKATGDFSYVGIHYLYTGSDLTVSNLYDSSQVNTIFGVVSSSKITINTFNVQYARQFSRQPNMGLEIIINNIVQVGGAGVINLKLSELAYRIPKLTIGNITLNGSIQMFASDVTFGRGTISSNCNVNFDGSTIVRGEILSTNYHNNTYHTNGTTFKDFAGKLSEIVLGQNGQLTFDNCNIEVNTFLAGRTTDSAIVSCIHFKGYNSVTQIDTAQPLFKTVGIGAATIKPIQIDLVQLNTNALGFGVNTSYTKPLSTFKEKLNETVVRSKYDLINRTLSSTINYIVDGTLTLIAGEFIEAPVGGLTLTGYGFDVSNISKNVVGESIFKSAVGGSGNIVTKEMQYNSGVGSVFDIVDSDGTHAIEMNDINFNNCASLGKIKGYRQFTGLTLGVYGCSNGFQLSGNWNGFSLSKLHVRSFAITGTLFRKDTDTIFSNRFVLESTNISGATGIKLTDFDATIFTKDELFQITNSVFEVAGVINESNTSGLIPNITANDAKSRWTNSTGITLTAVKFLDMKSPDGNIWRVTMSNAGAFVITDI